MSTESWADHLPTDFQAEDNVMTLSGGMMAVVSWEVGGQKYMVFAADMGLALAGAAQLEQERKENLRR